MSKHSKNVIKEHTEHKWATWQQAKRIASDHAKKERKHHPKKGTGIGPIKTATKDFTLLYGGAKRIAYQKKP